MENTNAIGFTEAQMQQILSNISDMMIAQNDKLNQVIARNDELMTRNMELSTANGNLATRVSELEADLAGQEMPTKNVCEIKKCKKVAVTDAINIDGVEYVPNYRKYFRNLEGYLRKNSGYGGGGKGKKLDETKRSDFESLIRGCERWVDERDMDGGD